MLAAHILLNKGQAANRSNPITSAPHIVTLIKGHFVCVQMLITAFHSFTAVWLTSYKLELRGFGD